MAVIKAILKGVGGIWFVGSLALSFAPATLNEQLVLGPDSSRMELIQRRLAIGFRDLAPEPALGLLAQAADITPTQLNDALDTVINPVQAAAPIEQLAEADLNAVQPSAEPARTIRAGGALFIKAD